MSKVHNMFRLVGNPGTDEFDVPAGYKLVSANYLGVATVEEQNSYAASGGIPGPYKMLYVLVPVDDVFNPLTGDVVRKGRPPKA